MNPNSAHSLSRRGFLQAAVVGSTALAVAVTPGVAASLKSGSDEIVDCNVSLFQWPTRRLPLDEPKLLGRKLRRSGVVRAWASSFEGLLHKDIAGVNLRLAEACARDRLFAPIGVINPSLPRWRADLTACAEIHRMRGIRLFPNYHGYKLDDAVVEPLLHQASELGLLVQISLAMEDVRMQNHLLRATPVDAAPLTGHLGKLPEARVMLLNWAKNTPPALVATLARTQRVFFDIAMLESVGGIETLLKSADVGRVVFGSHAPFYYFEAAKLKLQESPLNRAQLAAVSHGNAAALIT